MDSWTLKERIGLPIWDGEFVVGTRTVNAGETITRADFEEAQQDEDEIEMLVQHNCFNEDELKAIETKKSLIATASVSDANEALPTQEEK